MNWKHILASVALIPVLAGAARAEGQLNIYNWGNLTSPSVIKKFEKKFDVKVTLTDFDSSDTAIAKVRAGGHGFDMVVPSHDQLPIWIEEGLLLETDPYKMENFKHIAPEWANPDFDPGRKYSVPFDLGTAGVIVDTAVYKGDIDTWAIIFDTPPELQGKVNVIPELSGVIYAAIKYLGGEQCTTDIKLLSKVRDLLVKSKPNWVSMQYDTIPQMDASDFAATNVWSGTALRIREAKSTARYGYPKEGFFYWSDNVVVLKDARNVENAKLFQNFIMDPQIAAELSEFHGANNGISGSLKFMPEFMQQSPEINVPEEVKARGEIQQMCSSEARELYAKIWTQIQK